MADSQGLPRGGLDGERQIGGAGVERLLESLKSDGRVSEWHDALMSFAMTLAEGSSGGGSSLAIERFLRRGSGWIDGLTEHS